MTNKDSSQKGLTTKIEIEIDTQINPIAVIFVDLFFIDARWDSFVE